MTGRRATRPPRSGPADAPRSEAQARYVAAQQRIAASAADERRRRRERRPRVRDRWVSSLLLSAVVGISTSGWLLTRIDLPDSAASTTDDRPSLPEFDEELAEPDSYRVTFRGPSYLSPSPWFEAVRGAGSDSIVVDIDQDGPGAMASIALLVRREGSWYLDLDAGVTRGQASSDGTTWVGYDDAWVSVGGRRVQSVPGGTHWGAGLSISASDQARLAQLVLQGGAWDGAQIVPREWITRMHEPCALAPFYGWLTWLNRDGRTFPGASTQGVFMVGAGGHYIWTLPEHDAVAVVRWLNPPRAAAFMARVSRAFGG